MDGALEITVLKENSVIGGDFSTKTQKRGIWKLKSTFWAKVSYIAIKPKELVNNIQASKGTSK